MSAPITPENNNFNGYISQVFVIHETGVVFLARRYNPSCFSEETQLIGGFLGALLNFVEVKTHEKNCLVDPTGFHFIQEIKMSCSNWLVRKHDDCFIVIISERSSIVSQPDQDQLKNELLEQTSTTIDIIKSFQEIIHDHIFLDHSDEFGVILDNMFHETLSTYLDQKNNFQEGTEELGLGASIFTTGTLYQI